MRPSLLQQQLPDLVDTFRCVLVYGGPEDAILLLGQALPLIAAGAEIHVVEPAGHSRAERALHHLLERLSRSGVRVRRERLPRPDVSSFMERAARGHDLVLKATAPGRTQGATLDRLDTELLASCPGVVWFGRYGRKVLARRIVAALDSQQDDEVSRQLAERVLRLGDSAAAATGAELHVLHAWFLLGAELLKNRMPEELARDRRQAAEDAERHTRDLVRRSRGDIASDRLHLLEGAPEFSLPLFINAKSVDLTLIGTRGRRSRISRALRPQLARTILEETCCSVVVVKPQAV